MIVPTGGDKLAHFVTYALLAWLLVAAWGPRVSVVRWHVLFASLGFTLGYGVLDEWIQPIFGRHCIAFDWLADAAGAATELAAYAAGAFDIRWGLCQDT